MFIEMFVLDNYYDVSKINESNNLKFYTLLFL